MLRAEGIKIQFWRNHDVKYAVVEHAFRPNRDKLYKYFTYKNTFRYIDSLPKFFSAYNDTVLSTTCMAPSRVSDSGFIDIWKRMEARDDAFSWLKSI